MSPNESFAHLVGKMSRQHLSPTITNEANRGGCTLGILVQELDSISRIPWRESRFPISNEQAARLRQQVIDAAGTDAQRLQYAVQQLGELLLQPQTVIDESKMLFLAPVSA